MDAAIGLGQTHRMGPGTTLEQRLAHLEDLEAIRRLLYTYHARLDNRDFDGYAQLFTADGEWHGATGEVRASGGPGPIAAMLRSLYGEDAPRDSWHVCTNPVIDLDGDEARVRSTYVVLNRPAEGAATLRRIGEYVDHVVRDQDGRWRFRQRRSLSLAQPPVP